MAVAVVVQKTAARAPTIFDACHACAFGDIREGAVSVVAVQDVAAEVGDEEVVVAVVVEVADAAGLAPAGMGQPGFSRDVGEGAVAVVMKEKTGRLARGGRR